MYNPVMPGIQKDNYVIVFFIFFPSLFFIWE